MNNVLINPKVPKWMDYKDIEERSASHIAKWWNVPYIVFETFEKEPYLEYKKRLKKLKIKVETFEEYELKIKDNYLSWIKNWNTGIRYDVRILNGGAWDRTTWKGSFNSLDKAIECCKKLKKS